VQSFRGNAIFVDWEGPTYLINRRLGSSMDECILRFFFEDHIAGWLNVAFAQLSLSIEFEHYNSYDLLAFRVGAFGMQNSCQDDSKKELVDRNCFAYITFHGSIYVYPNEFL
jgi:hypothetical protein